jgi:hypothetical protein
MTVRTADGATGRVQRAITRLAAAEDLSLVENRPVTLDLETVFLHLVNDRGRVA